MPSRRLRPSLLAAAAGLIAAATLATLVRAAPEPAAVDEAAPVPRGYRMVWHDEFDGTGLPDPGRWSFDTSRNAPWSDEDQYYTPAAGRNAWLDKGRLVIEARRANLDASRPDVGKRRFTSAMLTSRGGGWKYGYVEVRAKVPCGRGSFPAVWMMPSQPARPWPKGGEIDIMEYVGWMPMLAHGTFHMERYNMKTTPMQATRKVPDICDAFHRYQLHWTPDRMTAGIDDHAYAAYARNGSADQATWPFDRKFYLILNLAVGGGWAGQRGIDEQAFPMRMEVDYVRIFQAPAPAR